MIRSTLARIALACSLFLLVADLSFGADPESKSTGLKVMTYNLRYASPTGANAWPARRPLMKELIRSVNPDVFGTQEGLYSQLKDLETDLKDYDWIGLGREGGSKGEFMAVFYKKERLEPMAFDHFWLSDTPELINSSTWGNSVKRMVTWVLFKERKSGKSFYLVNTHFDHQVQVARERSASLLKERIGALNPGVPLILTGDFNCTTNNPAYQTLTTGGFLKDSWYQAAKRENAGFNTFQGFGTLERNDERIDWILYRGNVDVKSTAIVTWSKGGEYPSDHCPVVADFVLK